MADGFRIPFQEAESEFVEKRSRFISHVWRVETEEEAQARIQETKKKYYDARHNCWCYLLGPNLVRYSDEDVYKRQCRGRTGSSGLSDRRIS